MIKIQLDEPVVVAQAGAGVRHWGPYQFPSIQWLPDGRLAVGFHVEADSAVAYGKRGAFYVSADEGHSWEPTAWDSIPMWSNSGKIWTLPNGDQLRQEPLRSIDPGPVRDRLPEPVGTGQSGYGHTIEFFKEEEIPADLKGFRFSRKGAGSTEWVEEQAEVKLPGALQRIYMEVLVFPWFTMMQQAPDGSLWGILYDRRWVHGAITPNIESIFTHSADGGRTWEYRSSIPYQPDPSADLHAAERAGFTEPNLVHLPDGSIFALLRTTDGIGPGPMYRARSEDDGNTWSQPVVFDDLGVYPALLSLKNGVTLASYGRPGLYLRATADSSGREWDDRITIVEPGDLGRDTCSYTDLCPLSDHEALLVYSDFNYPDLDGAPVKTILVRKVTVL